MSEKSATGSAVRAFIIPPAQGDIRSPGHALVEALVAGAETTRYGRRWLVGQPSTTESGMLAGRLGFEREGQADQWDESLQDFEEISVPSGQSAPFVIDLRSLDLLFQVKSRLIVANGFTGALQGIIRERTRESGWHVRQRRHEATFDEWAQSVSRVTRLTFSLHPPNPNYRGRPTLEKIIGNLGAVSTTVNLSNSEGLDLDKLGDVEIVQEMIQHVELEYGTQHAAGPDEATDSISTWKSESQGAAERLEVEIDSETGDASPRTLENRLRESTTSEIPWAETGDKSSPTAPRLLAQPAPRLALEPGEEGEAE